MKKIRKSSKLFLGRETVGRLENGQLRQAGGGSGARYCFTDDCTYMPSFAQCSMPCTLSCLP